MMDSILETFKRSTLFIKISIFLHILVLLSLLVVPSLWPWALAVLIANHLLIAAIGLWPRSHWLGSNWTKLPLASAVRNEIALTIDDGPDPLITPQVLEILDHFNVKATFFCIGHKAVQHTELCREMIRRGHAIENHSQQHKLYFSLLGVRGLTREIMAAQETLLSITGMRPQFFRAPAGLRNPLLAPVLERLNLQLASWTVRGFDTKVTDAEKVKNKLIAKLEPGSILLLHDGNAASTKSNVPVILAVLPSLLKAGNKRGLNFVTLAEAAQ
jgi:peptidoglycan-N-acetylglucosamine deacetylase